MNVKEPSSGSDSTSLLQRTDLLLKKTSLERPEVPFSGESRYLTRLWVFGNREPWEELHPSDSSLSRISSFKSRAETAVPHYHEIKEKTRAALKLLTFREQHVLVQFWAPHVVGKHRLLTTVDQPFGLGAVDEGLFLYRRDSAWNPFIVDKDHEEEDCGPPARVYRRGLPEWTCDLTNYRPKDFPLQELAISCKLFGYLALPVFDSTTRLCVGVLELLMSSKYVDYAYEVNQIHLALKTMNLTSQPVFDYPTSNVPSERRQNRMDKIHSILKVVCDVHGLPLAQTWAVSPFSSFVAHEKGLEKSCNSFNSRCIGKVCMSTAALPYYVRDLSMWNFRESCRKQHLKKSHGFVGGAFLSHGSCFCGDVSELSEEEYPLVYNARMSGLTSCFTTFLRCVDGDDDEYVLEFFIPSNIKDGRYLLNLVQTLKHNIEVTSGFELGDISSIEGVENLSFGIEPPTIQISSTTEPNTLTVESDSSDSEANVSKTAIVPIQWPSKQNDPNKSGSTTTHTETLAGDDVVIDNNVNAFAATKDNDSTSSLNAIMQKANDTFTNGGKKNRLKQGRKRKIDSLTLEAIRQHLGRPIGQAAERLGVSRSTLKRFCREHNISSWPLANHGKKTAIINESKLVKGSLLKQDLKWSLSVHLGVFVAVLVVVKLKRWSCSTKCHGFSAKWWICGKHRLTSSESCFGIYQAVQLMMCLRRWRNKSTRNAIRYGGYHTGKLQYISNVVTPRLNDDRQLPYSDFVHASPKPSAYNVLDMDMLTVKVTYKDDMIKIRFPVSSGLLDLENEVAKRIKLQGRRLLIKYRDEDDDLVLIACDADLHNLLWSSGGNTTLKLLVDLADN